MSFFNPSPVTTYGSTAIGLQSGQGIRDKKEIGNVIGLADELNVDGTLNLVVADGINTMHYRLTKKQVSRFLEDIREMHVLQHLVRSE